jgi:alcohol dehydrogenase/propanol-preferring alcohol dehydrogenase
MAKTRAAILRKAGSPLEIIERDTPRPPSGSVRVRIEACGICHSDVLARTGAWPGIEYPRVPGHEIAGVVEELGAEVSGWAVGDRVGVGWHGGHDNSCIQCRRGQFILCRRLRVPGLSYDGGYAQHVVVPAEALARIPGGLAPAEAAPLMCAGVTTFNALRHTGASAGDVVAILGIGGLGHLAVQFAAKMGFATVAIARGPDKEPFARELGARHYIDSRAVDVAAALQALGGARAIMSTVTSGKATAALIGGLAPGGTLFLIGISEDPIAAPSSPMIMGGLSLAGWPAGTAMDSQDTLAFAAQSGVRPRIETFPLARAEDGYQRMMSGAARFRVVLVP